MRMYNEACIRLMKKDFYKEMFKKHQLTLKYKKYQ